MSFNRKTDLSQFRIFLPNKNRCSVFKNTVMLVKSIN